MGDRAAASARLSPNICCAINRAASSEKIENLLSSGVHMPKTIDEKAVELPPPE